MFYFKHFSVEDSHSTMKVGTDAVLLGALSPSLSRPSRILEIGCGCGVVSLIAAQLNPEASIDALDIDGPSVAECESNFMLSPWHDRLHAIHADVKAHTSPTPYDLVICNPPFFQNSLKAPDQRRSNARHTDLLSFTELIDSVSRLLSPDGCFSCILPCREADQLVAIASAKGLFCSHKTVISNKPSSPPKRTVLTLSRQLPVQCDIEEVCLRDEENRYSAWYTNLTNDLYLNL